MNIPVFLSRPTWLFKAAGRMPAPRGPGILPGASKPKQIPFPFPAQQRLCCLLPILALLAGCSWFGGGKSNNEEEKPADEGPQLVGRIATIPAEKKFVLIQSYGIWKIETGTILTTRGPDERSANLLVTGEAMGQFAAADLQSGTVEIGDAVYSRHVPKLPEAAAEPVEELELPENQIPGELENVQKNN